MAMHSFVAGMIASRSLPFGADDATALWLDLAGAAALKASVLVVVAALATFAMRQSSASARHAVWAGALFGMLALPALSLMLPAWRSVAALPAVVSGERVNGAFVSPGAVAISRVLDPVMHANMMPHREPGSGAAPGSVTDARTSAMRLADGNSPRMQEVEDNTNSNALFRTLAKLWAFGATLGLFAILASRRRVSRLAHASREAADPRLQRAAASIARELRIARTVRLLQSDHAAMPATWGVLHPVILLPSDAHEWPTDRAHVVLLHELTHVKRWDCLSQLIAGLACAMLWFHPAAWYAAARLRVERELACDEDVLAAGTDACDYAAHLVDVARSFRTTSLAGWAAVGMARPSNLESRVRTILRADRGGTMRTALARATISGAMGLFVLLLSALRPAEAPHASLDNLATLTDTVASLPPMPASTASASLGGAALAVRADSAADTASIRGAGSASTVRNGTVAAADTFRWSGRIEPGRWIEVYNAIGDIRAEATDAASTEVLVVGTNGALGSNVRIVAKGSRDGTRVCPVYTDDAGQWDMCDPPGTRGYRGSTSLSVIVRVPRGVGMALHAMKGDVIAEGMRSYVWGTSIDGNVRISTSDVAEASTYNGNITAKFNRARWTENLEFLTESGDISVTAPTNASTLIEVVGSRGQVESEWALKHGSINRALEQASGATSPDSIPRVRQVRGALTLHTGKGRATLLRGAAGDASADPSYSSAPSSAPRDPKPDQNPGSGYNPNPAPVPSPDPSANDGKGTDERFAFTVPDALIQRLSAASLRGARDSAAISRLRMLALQAPKHEADLVAVRAQWALTLVQGGRIAEPLVAALSDSDWRVRAFAAWAIGASGVHADAGAVVKALKDEHWRVRMHAAYALQQMPTRVAFDALLDALSDPEWQVRIGAVDALVALGDQRALGTLRRMASADRAPIVRESADEAVRRLANR